MKTALVISTYNYPQALELILMSIQNQIEMPDEILIADDGSTEQTRQLIDSFRDKIPVPIHHIWHQDNGYQLAKIRNKAVASATSDYIIQIDGDCFLHPNFIQEHKRFAKRGRYLYGTRVRISEKYVPQVLKEKKLNFSFFDTGLIKRFRSVHFPFFAYFYAEIYQVSSNLRGCNMSFWRDDFLKINGYNEDFSGWGREDQDLAIRLHHLGIKGKRIKFAGIMFHLDHPESSKFNMENNDRLMKKTLSEGIITIENGAKKYLSDTQKKSKEKIKVLHLTTIKELRGGDVQLYNYVVNSNENLIENHTLTVHNSVLSQMLRKEKKNVHLASKEHNFDFRYSQKILKVAKKEDIDIIHIHDSSALTLYLLVNRFLKNVKVVYTRKSNNPIRQKKINLKKYNFPRIKKITCVSEAVKKEMEKAIVDKSKLQVIYDGIDLKKYSTWRSNKLRKEFNIQPDEILVGNISSLSEVKDLPTFIDTAELLKKHFGSKIKFIIIGEGPLEKDLKEYAKSKGLENDLIFTGFRTDIPEIISDFDVTLVCSKMEGLGVVVLESFACEVPVVSTQAGGLKESVVEGITGLTASVGDAQEFAKKTIQLLQNQKLRINLVKNAKEKVIAHYSIEKMCETYEKLYQTLLHG